MRDLEAMLLELEDLRELERHAGWQRVERFLNEERGRILNAIREASSGDVALKLGGQLLTLDTVVNWVKNRIEVNTAVLNRTKKEQNHG